MEQDGRTDITSLLRIHFMYANCMHFVYFIHRENIKPTAFQPILLYQKSRKHFNPFSKTKQ